MSDGYTVKVRPEKVEAVEEIKSELGAIQAAVVTEYRGLTVTALKTLREQLGAQDTSYRVVKNTLARRAAADLGFGELEELFVGPVAVAYVKGDPVAAAKILATFAREHPDLIIKGGILEGRVISGDEANNLATVDPLDVSRAKIAGLLTGALRQLAFLLEAPAGRILYVLEELGKRGGEPEAQAAAEETAPEAQAAAEETAPEAQAAAEETAPAAEAAPAEPEVSAESAVEPEATTEETRETEE